MRSGYLSLLCVVGALVFSTDHFAAGLPGDSVEPYDSYDEDATETPSNSLVEHIIGVVDVDFKTFDKIVMGRPTFVTFYDGTKDASEVVQDKWILESVADALGEHLRLLMVKVDVSGQAAENLAKRFGISKTPYYALLDGDASPKPYVLDYKDDAVQDKLVNWLLDQVCGHSV
jgi:hypothetical protein